MAIEFSGSQDIEVTVAATQVGTGPNPSISAWFKSTNAGTTRLNIYTEADPISAGTDFILGLNDGVAGRVSVLRRASGGNTVSIGYNGSYNDGAWHLATFVSRSSTDHELFVDGVSRATSSTSLVFSDSIGFQTIGVRKTSSGKTGNFVGSIADVMLHTVALSLAEHTTLYNKTKNAFNAAATGATNLRSYFPLHNIGSDRRNVTDGHLNDAPTTLTGTPTWVDGPSGAGPTGMTESTDLYAMRVAGNPTTTLVTRGGSTTDGDYLLREPGNVLHTPLDTGKEYKFYYAGTPNTYAGNDPSIWLAYSSDLVTWTKYGQVISAATLPQEDPYVLFNGTYHMWCENKTGKNNSGGISYFTSADGLTWTLGSATALDKGGGGAWDSQDVASPVVTYLGGVWYMLYEGRQTAGQQGQMGLATASSPAGPWTKDAANPVFVGRSGKWDEAELVLDDLVRIAGTYHLFYHAKNAGGYWGNGVASSSDLITWTRQEHSQLTGRNQAYTLMRLGGTQYGSAIAIDEADGNVKLFRGFGDAATQTSEYFPFASPNLTSASAATTGDTTASWSVSTDVAGGTLYRAATSNASESSATVRAAALSQSVSSSGSQSGTFSGLTAGTTYYAHFVHVDSLGQESNTVSSGSFVTSGDVEPPPVGSAVRRVLLIDRLRGVT